jgi:acetoin utilization deacetylase AcuC-like enzyme
MNFKINLDNSFDDDIELTFETDHGGIIVPKQTCEHVQHVHLFEEFKHINNNNNNNQCIDCENSNENWLCLSCGEIRCSRYINNHGEEHWLFTLLTDEQFNIGHCLTISLQDLSVWCYPCKSYIKNIRLNPIIKYFETKKFGLTLTNQTENPSHCDQINHLIIPIKNSQNPSTIIAIQDRLLLDVLKKTDLLSYCYTIKLRPASIDELVHLHSSDYVNMIVSAERSHMNISNNHFHLQYNETTFFDARLSAGITLDVIQNVLNNHINGFILSTSPGHCAFNNHGNGTSIYNNIALAINSILTDKIILNKRKTSLALIDSNNHLHMEGATPIENAICHMIHVLTPASPDEHRLNCQMATVIDKNKKIQIERVLILDITREHGCGIQSIYYESDQVFYISIHKETHQHRSSYHECGKNSGLGYTMNIPLSSIDKINDKDYVNIMNELILPITKEFQPELIIVCVDFHIENLTTLSYAWIIEQLSMINNSKLVVALDGDLSCISLKTSYVETVLSVLIGKLSVINNDEWKNNSDINIDVRQKIDLIKEKHKQYWSCLQ